MFFFKDLENENSFNIMKKTKEINELIYKTELPKEQGKSFGLDSSEIQSKESKAIKNSPPKKIETPQVNKEENNNKTIKIYNSRKKTNEKNARNSYNLKNKNNEDSKISRSHRPLNEKYEDNIFNEEYENNYEKYKNDRMRNNNLNFRANMNFKSKDLDENKFDFSMGTNMEDSSSETEKPQRKKIKVYNSFNIFEIIITQFFKCCKTRSMEIKNDANEKANSILFSKMDINTYVRNMILFDIINQTILDENKKIIVNFLCRPVICYDKKPTNYLGEFYKKYKEKDFIKFSEKIEALAAQEKKEEREKRMIFISNENLKAFI